MQTKIDPSKELPDKAHLRPKEIAAFLGIGPSLVYEMIHDGQIPSKRISGLIRIPRGAFVDWLDKLPGAE